MSKTIQAINDRIAERSARVVRADEMTRIVRDIGPERAAEEVDVVTTGTFGAMCSSGVWLNFGHSNPPIKMERIWLNDVEAYAGVAAVDAYLGATQPSEKQGIQYGGSHVIQDLLEGKPVILRAVSRGTDCYPRKRILTRISLNDLNFSLMSNPRNGYQRYNAAANSSERTLYTYMGKLLPRLGNVTFSGAGELSPLMNDPDFKTIGLGTRIFVGGAPGYITGSGTQHFPQNRFGTLMVQADLKKMSAEFIRAATFTGYGCTLYVGIGIPIPVLDSEIAKNAAIGDEEIYTEILDYSVPGRNRPSLRKVSYSELKSGTVEVNGKPVRTSPLSSFFMAMKIAEALKEMIKTGQFKLTLPVETLPDRSEVRSLEIRSVEPKQATMELPCLPESEKLSLNKIRCIRCGLCLSVCPEEVFRRDQNWEIQANGDSCSGCGQCADACPVRAIRVAGR